MANAQLTPLVTILNSIRTHSAWHAAWDVARDARTVCKERSKKCDEKYPSCTQCTRGGRQCSGALSTVFLIVESETVNSNPTYKPRDTGKSYPEAENAQSTSLVGRPKKRSKTSAKTPPLVLQSKSSRLDEPSLPLTVKSPQVHADHFLSLFITFFSQPSPCDFKFDSWMVALPDMLAARSVAVEKSVFAAAMTIAGRESCDPSVVFESYNWYGTRLAKQRKVVEALQREKRLPSIEEICNALLLCLFEVTCNPSPTPYFQHLTAAARFLEMRGPEDCISGIPHQLFLTLRIQMLHPAILLGIPSIFATEKWLTIPFKNRAKSLLSRIIDVLTKCSSMLAQLAITAKEEIQRAYLIKEAIELKQKLDLLWESDMKSTSRARGWTGNYFGGIPGFDFDYGASEPGGPRSDETIAIEHPGDLIEPSSQYGQQFHTQSREMTFYSTARILVLSILNELGQPPTLFREQMEVHCESILSIAGFSAAGYNVKCAYMRLVLPLNVVTRLSPLPSQKERARLVCQNWLQERGLAGQCDQALSNLQAHN